jgi:hypothetical protein
LYSSKFLLRAFYREDAAKGRENPLPPNSSERIFYTEWEKL